MTDFAATLSCRCGCHLISLQIHQLLRQIENILNRKSHKATQAQLFWALAILYVQSNFTPESLCGMAANDDLDAMRSADREREEGSTLKWMVAEKNKRGDFRR